ncbi:FliM/FliN family flagellar motor C-terminal domain-containing protein [Ferrimonas marina]|uniref:Flagellar motor switch protein FliN n=1 Tax=Ferrimonas marina TaxID=299255 RepID=A0A1M5TEQ6_9GAMM|nr:FliM/FliN family flagellar motor C-terminal domain-containing protein [Ferrimonas marina]SHH49194.1 Flagellar motor switch/type III secretory pathway protein FliN [Ferrimonas marina]
MSQEMNDHEQMALGSMESIKALGQEIDPNSPAASLAANPAILPPALELQMSVVVGNVKMSFDDIGQMVPGQVLPLHKQVNDDIDLMINGTPLAKGQVVTHEGNYYLKITKLVEYADQPLI